MGAVARGTRCLVRRGSAQDACAAKYLRQSSWWVGGGLRLAHGDVAGEGEDGDSDLLVPEDGAGETRYDGGEIHWLVTYKRCAGDR
jgi:hypothetical protein